MYKSDSVMLSSDLRSRFADWLLFAPIISEIIIDRAKGLLVSIEILIVLGNCNVCMCWFPGDCDVFSTSECL
jgi:hypothetical protein